MREPEPIRARLREKSFSAFCKIWARREAKGDPVLVGKFFLNGGSVTFEVGPGGSDEQMKRLMAEPNLVGGDKAFASIEEDPPRWFSALPLTYHGFRFWAGKIQERAASTAKRRTPWQHRDSGPGGRSRTAPRDVLSRESK